jgi:hypothetical protein
MGRTRLLAVAVCAAAVAALGASSAFAGEIKGPPYKGDPVSGGIGTSANETAAEAHSHSLCSFSGLNDYDADLGQNARQTQTPKDAAPGSAAHGWTITIPGVGEVTISCNPNGPVG